MLKLRLKMPKMKLKMKAMDEENVLSARRTTNAVSLRKHTGINSTKNMRKLLYTWFIFLFIFISVFTSVSLNIKAKWLYISIVLSASPYIDTPHQARRVS